jgi:hypothetical protein
VPLSADRNGQLIFSMWIRPSCTGSTELAIYRILRAAASGSEKGRLETNFRGCFVLFLRAA